MARWTSGLLAGLLWLLPGGAGATAERAPQDYTAITGLTEPRFGVERTSVRVPVRDGTELHVEVVRPTAPGRYPVVMELSPYHGTLADRTGSDVYPATDATGQRIGLTGYFAPRGYAVVIADLRGTGRSGGCLDLVGPKDQADAYDLVTWAGTQPWSNGRVGMIGHSYPGFAAIMAAAQHPPHLATIVPSAGAATFYGHSFQHGVLYNDSFLGPLAVYQGLATLRHLPGQDSFGQNTANAGCEWLSSTAWQGEPHLHGVRTPWYAARDFSAAATASTVPVFLVHGVPDHAVSTLETAWFTARGGRPGDKLWLGQWDHGTTDFPYPNDRGRQWLAAVHAWFDRHLIPRGPHEPAIETGPAVELFLNTGEVITADAWPLPTRTLGLHPHPDGSLRSDPPAGGTLRYRADPTPAYQGDPRYGLVPPGPTAPQLWFQTDVLPEDLVLAGAAAARLVASLDGVRVDLMATLYDVPPTGSPRRIEPATVAVNPELRDGLGQAKPVVPGQVMTMQVPGTVQAHVLRAGHRLGLAVASADLDKLNAFSSGSNVTLHLGAAGTRIDVQVLEGARRWPDSVPR